MTANSIISTRLVSSSLKRSRSAVDKRVPISSGKLCSIRNVYARRRSPSFERSARPVVVSPEPQTTVRFSRVISIHEIPSHKDYSKEEKEAMWMPRLELKKLVRKNIAEVAFEGQDWRNAPEEEEEDFGSDGDGNPVHPVNEVNPVHPVNEVKTRRSSLLPCKKRKHRLAQRKLPLSLSCRGELDEQHESKRPRVEPELSFDL